MAAAGTFFYVESNTYVVFSPIHCNSEASFSILYTQINALNWIFLIGLIAHAKFTQFTKNSHKKTKRFNGYKRKCVLQFSAYATTS